jgi:hypothetical protein
MQDVSIRLNNRPGALAEMGEALVTEGISIEGGGAWITSENGVAHFLFADGEAVRRVLMKRGIDVIKVSEVLVQRLKQNVPGQLGKIARAMANAGVNIEVLYSDHYNQLILVVDNYEKGKTVSLNWTKGLY